MREVLDRRVEQQLLGLPMADAVRPIDIGGRMVSLGHGRVIGVDVVGSRSPRRVLISSYVTLDDINEAMDTLADGQAIRQVIRF